jgi:hypothetical protein
VENTEQLALKVLDLIKREAGSNNVALTMGLIGVHAPNYPVNLIHLWNGGPEERLAGNPTQARNRRQHI